MSEPGTTGWEKTDTHTHTHTPTHTHTEAGVLLRLITRLNNISEVSHVTNTIMGI